MMVENQAGHILDAVLIQHAPIGCAAGQVSHNLRFRNGLTYFLVNQLGLIPALQVVTDNPPAEFRDGVRAAFRNIAEDVPVEVEFEEDSHVIHERLRRTDFGHRPPIILGTTWERDVAKSLKAPLVEATFSTTYEVALSRSHVGYRGASTLLEKIYSTIVAASA